MFFRSSLINISIGYVDISGVDQREQFEKILLEKLEKQQEEQEYRMWQEQARAEAEERKHRKKRARKN